MVCEISYGEYLNVRYWPEAAVVTIPGGFVFSRDYLLSVQPR